MTIREVTFYKFVCDFPGCEKDAHTDEGGEYAAWGDRSAAAEDAVNAMWRMSEDHSQGYCMDHPCTWLSDAETGDGGYDITQFPSAFPQVVLDDDGDAHLIYTTEALQELLDNSKEHP